MGQGLTREKNIGKLSQNSPKLVLIFWGNVVCIYVIKDEETFANKHELLQYSVRTINNGKVSRITYPRKMHAFYEKTSLDEPGTSVIAINWHLPDKPPTAAVTYPQ